MKKISKFECNEIKIMPIKEIYYYDEDNSIIVYHYNNARYNELSGRISLAAGYDWEKTSYYNFDKIQHNNIEYVHELNDLRVFTKNLDKKYEEELIEKIIDFRKKELSDKLFKIEELKRSEKRNITIEK